MFTALPKKKPQIDYYDLRINVSEWGEIQCNKKFVCQISPNVQELVEDRPNCQIIKFPLQNKSFNSKFLIDILHNIPVPVNSATIKSLRTIAEAFDIASLKKEIKTFDKNNSEACMIDFKEAVLLDKLSILEQKLSEISEENIDEINAEISFFLSSDTDNISSTECASINENPDVSEIQHPDKNETKSSQKKSNREINYNDDTSLVAYLILQMCFARPEKIDLYLALIKKCDNSIQSDFKEIFLNNIKQFKENYKTYGYIAIQCLKKKMLFKNTDFIEAKNDYGLDPYFSESLKVVSSKVDRTNIEEIAVTLRNDDLNNLIKLFENDPLFNVNGSVEIDKFERNQFLSDRYRVSYLEYSGFFGANKCFDFLKINGAKIEKSIIHYIISGGNIDLIHKCEDANNFNDRYLLDIAIDCHHSDIFEWLLETKQVEHPCTLSYLIEKCLRKGCYTILSNLQEKNEELQIKIYELSFFLAQNYFISSLKKIIFNEEYYKLDILSYQFPYKKNTIVHILMRKGFFELVKEIITNFKINFNIQGKLNQTILHLAIIYGRGDLTKLIILKDNVNINMQDDFGFTALHYATLCEHVNIMKLLLKQKNVNVNMRSFYNFHSAPRSASKYSIRRSYNMVTPLHVATMKDFVNGVKLLIKHPKINIYVPNCCQDSYGKLRNNVSAITIADRKKNSKIIKLFKKKMKDRSKIINS